MLRQRRGQSLVEYVVLFVVILAAAVGFLSSMRRVGNKYFDKTSKAIITNK